VAGFVYLVGAGPGDPGLVTLRAREVLGRADVVIADRLVGAAILADMVPPSAEVIVRGARADGEAQREINALLVERARRGQFVVRLKGGDPFVFGRGGEEAEALVDAGIPFAVVPGVTAAVAAPAYAGIPLTHRGLAGAVAFATGHETDDKSGGAVGWSELARAADTLVLYMSVKNLDEVMRRLVAAGRSADEPAAVIERGTTAEQRVVVGTIGDIVARVSAAGIAPPALTVVGRVVTLGAKLDWFARRKRILLVSTKAPRDERLPPDVDVTRVSPLSIVPRFADVKQSIARAADASLLAFVSAHAVEAFFAALGSFGSDARALFGKRVVAVGGATAESLAAHGIRADLVGDGGGAELARDIIASEWRNVTERSDAGERNDGGARDGSERNDAGERNDGGAGDGSERKDAGERNDGGAGDGSERSNDGERNDGGERNDDGARGGGAIVYGAHDGRRELSDALAAAGWPVVEVAAYESIADDGAINRALKQHRARPFDAVAFTSPRGADAFLQLAGDTLKKGAVKIGAIGATTRDALARRGIAADAIPPSPDVAALIDALAKLE
jgi:uroporphyrinogen III methyltransferase / synthase